MYNKIIIPQFSEETFEYHCYNQGCQFLATINEKQYTIVHEHTCQQPVDPVVNEQCEPKENETMLIHFSMTENCDLLFKENEILQNRYGLFRGKDFKHFGCKIYNTKNQKFAYALRYTPELFTSNLQRLTQVIYSPDISLILERTNVLPTYHIVEAGIGSCSLNKENYIHLIYIRIELMQPLRILKNMDFNLLEYHNNPMFMNKDFQMFQIKIYPNLKIVQMKYYVLQYQEVILLLIYHVLNKFIDQQNLYIHQKNNISIILKLLNNIMFHIQLKIQQHHNQTQYQEKRSLMFIEKLYLGDKYQKELIQDIQYLVMLNDIYITIFYSKFNLIIKILMNVHVNNQFQQLRLMDVYQYYVEQQIQQYQDQDV